MKGTSVTKYTNDAQMYLEMYPHLKKKWVNQCVLCQREGYKPNLPREHSNIRKYFEPLALNELGECQNCVSNVGDSGNS